MANKQVYTNNATAALNSAITAATTSIVLQSGQGSLFPSPSGGDWFLATIYDGASTIEIVKCTARTTDTLTVTRAQEGTTAAAFSAGSSFEMAVTKGTLEQFVQRTGDTVSVAMGGTGATTLTNHGVVIGQGTSAVAVTSAGTAGHVLTSNGAGADPTFQVSSAGSVNLLATLTPTASANVDFLSTFSSSYDYYIIIGEGIIPATDDSLVLRLATGGSADTGSNYASTTNSTGTFTTTATSFSICVNIESSGAGVGFRTEIINANSSSGIKNIFNVATGADSGAGSTWRVNDNAGVYIAANTVSGGRLYWSSGANFSATGKIKIYGVT